MSGKSSKKSNDNFEKMKNEMNNKKQKAMVKQKNEVIEVENVTTNVDIESSVAIESGKVEMFDNSSMNIRHNKLDDNLINNKQKDSIIKFLVFQVGAEEFAIALTHLKEIVRLPILFKVPSSPQYIAGLFSLRGGLIPVIDSRILFGMVEIQSSVSSRIIVTDINGKQVGIISDRVSQVVSIDDREIKEPPSSIKKMDGNLIKGMLILDNGNRIVMVLNCEKIIQGVE